MLWCLNSAGLNMVHKNCHDDSGLQTLTPWCEWPKATSNFSVMCKNAFQTVTFNISSHSKCLTEPIQVHSIVNWTLNSALLSAFFSSCNRNSALFLGQRPCVVPHAFACYYTQANVISQNTAKPRQIIHYESRQIYQHIYAHRLNFKPSGQFCLQMTMTDWLHKV